MKRNSFQCVISSPKLPWKYNDVEYLPWKFTHLVTFLVWRWGFCLFVCVNILSFYDSKQIKGNVLSEHINRTTGSNATAKHPHRTDPGCWMLQNTVVGESLLVCIDWPATGSQNTVLLWNQNQILWEITTRLWRLVLNLQQDLILSRLKAGGLGPLFTSPSSSSLIWKEAFPKLKK